MGGDRSLPLRWPVAVLQRLHLPLPSCTWALSRGTGEEIAWAWIPLPHQPGQAGCRQAGCRGSSLQRALGAPPWLACSSSPPFLFFFPLCLSFFAALCLCLCVPLPVIAASLSRDAGAPTLFSVLLAQSLIILSRHLFLCRTTCLSYPACPHIPCPTACLSWFISACSLQLHEHKQRPRPLERQQEVQRKDLGPFFSSPGVNSVWR